MSERTEQSFSPGTDETRSVFVVAGRLRRVGFIIPSTGDISREARTLYDSSPVFAAYYARAKAVLGYAISEFVIDGPEEYKRIPLYQDLGRYIYNQANLAVFAQSPEYQPPELVTGEGVGFLNALVIAESISFEDGLQLVDQRAHTMMNLSDKAVISYSDFLDQQEQAGVIKPAGIPIVALTDGRLIQEPWEIMAELEDQLTEKEDWEKVIRTLRQRRIFYPLEIGARGAWSKMRENPKETAIVVAVAITAAGLTSLAWRLRRHS